MSGPKLVDWKKALESGEGKDKIATLKREVETFAEGFPMPGLKEI